MDKLKYVKIENEDGSLSDNIPLGVDAENVDVTSAGSQNLADYISVNDGKINSINSQIDDLQDNNTSLSNQIKSLSSGSPKGSYATVSALKSANPETGVYVIQENGHLYSWTKNGNDAIDLGVYQAIEPSNNSIYPKHMQWDYKRQLIPGGLIKIRGNTVTIPSILYVKTPNTAGWGSECRVENYPNDYPNGKFEFTTDDLTRIYFDYNAYDEGLNPFIVKTKGTRVDQEDNRYVLMLTKRLYGGRDCISLYGLDVGITTDELNDNIVTESKMALPGIPKSLVPEGLINFKDNVISLPQFTYFKPGTNGISIKANNYSEDYPDGTFTFKITSPHNPTRLYFDTEAANNGTNPWIFLQNNGIVTQNGDRYKLIFLTKWNGFQCPYGVKSNVTIEDNSITYNKLDLFNEREQELLLPDKIWTLDNNKYRIYKKSILLSPRNDRYCDVSLLSSKGNDLPYTDYIHDKIDINPQDLGEELRFGISSDLYKSDGAMFYKNVQIINTKSSELGNKSMNWIMFGDSLTAGGIPMWAQTFGNNYGLTLTSKGTKSGNGTHEGRSSYCFAHYIGYMTVLSADNSKPSEDLPFLKLATQQDKNEHPTWCFTKTNSKREKSYQDIIEEGGDTEQDFYIFDFEYYITQQSYEDINTVILSLGTNDWWQFGDDAINVIDLAYNIMSSQIWKYNSSIKIGVIPMLARGTSASLGTFDIDTSVTSRIGMQMDVLRNKYSNIDIIGSWMSHSGEVNFPYNESSELDYGVKVGYQTDSVHPTQEGYKEIGMNLMYYLASNLN